MRADEQLLDDDAEGAASGDGSGSDSDEASQAADTAAVVKKLGKHSKVVLVPKVESSKGKKSKK